MPTNPTYLLDHISKISQHLQYSSNKRISDHFTLEQAVIPFLDDHLKAKPFHFIPHLHPKKYTLSTTQNTSNFCRRNPHSKASVVKNMSPEINSTHFTARKRRNQHPSTSKNSPNQYIKTTTNGIFFFIYGWLLLIAIVVEVL